MRPEIPAPCRNGNAYPFPRLVGEELGALAVVGPRAVVARDQLPAPVQVTPAISVACGEKGDKESAGKWEKIHPGVDPWGLLPAKTNFHLHIYQFYPFFS